MASTKPGCVYAGATPRSRAMVARRAHNLKVGGSSPPFATTTRKRPSERIVIVSCKDAKGDHRQER